MTEETEAGGGQREWEEESTSQDVEAGGAADIRGRENRPAGRAGRRGAAESKGGRQQTDVSGLRSKREAV